MKQMFQSLEEAIVQVDKNTISFQNAKFDTMMDHLKQLASEVDNQRGDSLDQKLFFLEDEASSVGGQPYDSNPKSNSEKCLSLNDILSLEREETGYADTKVFSTKKNQSNTWKFVQIKILKIKDKTSATSSKLMIQISDVSQRMLFQELLM
jgi:hypothetical protein